MFALCGVGACACPISTRPTPTLDAVRKPGRHRVVFNAARDPVELSSIANPSVEGLRAPRRLTGTTENPIGFVRGGSLEPTRDRGQGHARRDQQVHMVGHDHPCVKFVKTAVGRSGPNGCGHDRGDAHVAQPARSGGCPVEVPILGYEPMSGTRIRLQNSVSFADRNRTAQSPRHKDRVAFVVNMRESSTVGEHLGRRKRVPHSSASNRGNSQAVSA